MITRSLALVAAASVSLGACDAAPPDSCKDLGRDDAAELARTAKVGMLARSEAAEQREFGNDVPTGVLLHDNGYAAKVEFKGVSGRRLVALIHDDCDVGWTGR